MLKGLKKMNIERSVTPRRDRMRKKMTKQAYHFEERLLKKPNIPSFHYCIFLRRRMREPN